MAIQFTERQQRVVDARGHNVLVSAAAGSGKTAVLTGRIVGMVCDPERPVGIDRLLVVTFTKAAASEMRERIGKALRERLAEDPANEYLQTQEVLLQKAQITTIDSFCTYVLRNHFSAIDLDPGFRQMDQTEADLLRADVMDAFLEEQYAEGDPSFLACEEYFCMGADDRRLADMILALLQQAESHPRPLVWLRAHRDDYTCADPEELLRQPWLQSCVRQMRETAEGVRMDYNLMCNLCLQGGGPYPYEEFLRAERDEIFAPMPPADGGEVSAEALLESLRAVAQHSFAKLPSFTAKKYPDVDPAAREAVKKLRDGAKKKLAGLLGQLRRTDAESLYQEMQTAGPHVQKLFDLTIAFRERLAEEKREKNAIDFSDLEHFALEILTQEQVDGTLGPSETALAFRKHYQEILIDEYQDSNEVQEVLLGMISGEQEGRCNRFMVGDVKQSIYKFRLARPEIFMDKYDAYTPGDAETERIDLDQNFRSREEVLAGVNAVFRRIMRREIGGIDYTDEAALKPGANYAMPDTEAAAGDPYRTELLYVCTKGGEDLPEDSSDEEEGPAEELTNPQKEAAVIAAKIRELVGHFPLQDTEPGKFRTARYGDIVILLRSAAGWNEQFREVFEKQGIPVHVDSRTGYFAAREIREALQLLRVLLNPRQDLALYSVMHGYFGGFTSDETAMIRANCREGGLCDALEQYAESGPDLPLRARCGEFLQKIRRWRQRVPFCTVAQLLTELFEESGYTDYCAALPGGEQRTANLQLLMAQADAFDRMSYTGLLRFLRYIDNIRQRELDAGEANILDENADVVRIMTIHKSKGLEFPICFVSGLAKRYSFRNDRGGSMLIDSDWGIGVDLADTRHRVRGGTLRKTAIGEKILRDSLGEELRVLYVAMTRAKEKLFLTMQVGDPDKTFAGWSSTAEAYRQIMNGKGPLPAEMLRSSSCFAQLIYTAVSGEAGMPAEEIGESGSALFVSSVVTPGDLAVSEQEELATMARAKECLLAAEQAAENGVPGTAEDLYDPALAEALRTKLSRRYAREDLRDLCLKTSVSELKHAAIERLAADMMLEEDSAGEGAAELFPDPSREEYIPFFARKAAADTEAAQGGETEAPAAGGERRAAVSGTAYGTAVHRFMECADMRRREEIAEDPQPFIDRMQELGLLTEEQAAALPRRKLRNFFRGTLAKRMARAAESGQLRKEQPFVLGISADRLRETLPQDETVMIQGIMDAFFVEDGGIVLIDYKTDRIRTGEELAERYRVQIDCYTEALERILELPVRERILYSFALEEEVRL